MFNETLKGDYRGHSLRRISQFQRDIGLVLVTKLFFGMTMTFGKTVQGASQSGFLCRWRPYRWDCACVLATSDGFWRAIRVRWDMSRSHPKWCLTPMKTILIRLMCGLGEKPHDILFYIISLCFQHQGVTKDHIKSRNYLHSIKLRVLLHHRKEITLSKQFQFCSSSKL